MIQMRAPLEKNNNNKKADHSMRIPIFEDRTPRRRRTTITQRFIAKGL